MLAREGLSPQEINEGVLYFVAAKMVRQTGFDQAGERFEELGRNIRQSRDLPANCNSKS